VVASYQSLPVTVYVASKGMIASCRLATDVEKEKWKDQGVRRCFPTARIVQVKAGHLGILQTLVMVKELQKGYI
jgi:hypothetical protein